MEDSVISVRSGGGVLKKRSSSGCLIIKRKDDRIGIGGIGSSKRPKFVMNDYESSDEISESIRRKTGQGFTNGSVVYGRSSVRDGEFGRNMNLSDFNKYEECDLKMQLNGYSDEISESIQRKNGQTFSNGSVVYGKSGVRDGEFGRNVNLSEVNKYQQCDMKIHLNGYSDDRLNMVERRGSCREFGSGSRSVVAEKRKLSYVDSSSSLSGSRTKGDDNGFNRRYDLLEDKVHMPISLHREVCDEPIRLQGKNGVLKVMVNKKKKIDLMPKEYDPVEIESRKGSLSADVLKRNLLVRPSFCSGSKQPEKLPLSIKTERNELKPQKPLLGKSIHLVSSEKDETDTLLKLAPPSVQPASSATRVPKEESRPLASEYVTPAKRKDGKVNRGGSTEKQQLRERIRGMLIEAGWTIDYRPRKNRDYLDAVYINPSGTAYWSIIKAYEAFQKRSEVDSGKSKPDGSSCSFDPISNDLINKLTRQTRKKMEKEMRQKRKDDGKRKDPKKTSVRESVLGTDSDQQEKRLGSYMKKKDKLLQGKLHATDEESGDNSSDNSLKVRRFKQDMVGKSSVGVASNSIHGRKSKLIGRCTLLVRHSDKGENPDIDGYVTYTGKRTLLSWLIDNGTLTLRQKIQYVNRRRTRVKLEGLITRDGVHCDCCSKILPVSKFELHAGSKQHQPFQNIVLESGASLLECLVDAWNKQKESDRQDFYNLDIDGDDLEDDACGICGDGGDLICCDGCPSTFHQSCLGIQMLPLGLWHCPNCTCKFCGAASRNPAEDSERTVNEFLSCSLCDKKYHKSCSLEMNGLSAISDNPSATFCGHKCQELYDHLQNILGVKHELEEGFSWSLIQRTDLDSDISRRPFPQKVECNSKLAVTLAVMDECFVPIVDRRSGINIIHNVLYNTGSNFSRLNFRGFYTAILERGDDIISAASIRIRGTQLAEMPFIGTRNIYRRQGMCRRLFSAIETVLSNLKVEKLIVPAMSEHLHIWTKVFGFDELEESNKQEMKSINMLVFPGTDLLQKKILKKGMQEACELQHNHSPSPALVEKADQESSIRRDGHLHDGVCVNIVEKSDDRFGPMDSGSPASAVHLSESTVVTAQGGRCESDIQISSKEVEKNFAESATKWMLSPPSGASKGSSDTEDAALHPAKIDVNSGVEPINQEA
ncbi:uncharacterized protein LOC132044681 [Lycium ferocissimum]|uniref:uncharacterized protein LOC132044681 n=1 Tax=Lycium ferocissimum TaxID=112874 RepID=UPI0028165929|nr:uncharacterized protein LOC132044681 [Lycium ferocissimum]XP_059291173.1 uncharacterized protein LOC132044681 [Lycium ferocissimum]XP_059291174.1 uncharacterized protein LOC132044681 [Lycium ferocissimum]